MLYPKKKQQGFSTIIAILMTAFLTILSASILNLFIVENNMNHFLSDGISAYMGAEGVLEYTLLKSTNHREGFSDIVRSDDKESLILNTNTQSAKKTTITSILEASGDSYTGSIGVGAFEIIPLFHDQGVIIQNSAKNPNKGTSNISKTSGFLVTQNSDIAWNIIGNDIDGNTYGISGTGSSSQSFGDNSSAHIQAGFKKEMNTTRDMMTASTQDISTFLTAYDNNYLILSNIGSASISYHISTSTGNKFSLPIHRISASSTVGKSKQNIDFIENRSRLFDMLKYSVFSK